MMTLYLPSPLFMNSFIFLLVGFHFLIDITRGVRVGKSPLIFSFLYLQIKHLRKAVKWIAWKVVIKITKYLLKIYDLEQLLEVSFLVLSLFHTHWLWLDNILIHQYLQSYKSKTLSDNQTLYNLSSKLWLEIKRISNLYALLVYLDC